MTDSIRQQIITKINTRFAAILISGGYQTNLGSHINWWRDLEKNPLQATEVPGANLKDSSRTPEPYSMGYDLHRLIVEIDIAATSPEEMRKAIADMDKAVHVDLTWTNLALYTIIQSDDSEVEHLDQKYSGSRMIMEIEYKTAMGNPYG